MADTQQATGQITCAAKTISRKKINTAYHRASRTVK